VRIVNRVAVLKDGGGCGGEVSADGELLGPRGVYKSSIRYHEEAMLAFRKQTGRR
jgi:hypothetical protein